VNFSRSARIKLVRYIVIYTGVCMAPIAFPFSHLWHLPRLCHSHAYGIRPISVTLGAYVAPPFSCVLHSDLDLDLRTNAIGVSIIYYWGTVGAKSYRGGISAVKVRLP